ncbi:LOW QUALITY PROTEIN: hypothetical protein MARPO_0059s0032 [Marchantia polymorpha]|uniref:MSP domain-containing protein n=1 Tax=Marchantia polymorpha TaxID=3197 RepID=A0A2R6WTC8_MARPO|nr:LOW QUALITY PROTEIN: hypothetical protein MARPO_0059s0032 [Marchantia polymorpha]|eukprot:PTQ37081.1 LOW QUALITY PROTEIN: hypothetical protein MARPO_0059s0032 [Marchantia polymorpha]
MDRLLILDPQDLTMRFEVGKKAVGMVQLTNVMHTMPVAYKIQTSVPRKYSFKPPHAIIPPLGKVTIEIAMNAQNELPECFPQCSDKFTVKSVVVPSTGSPPDGRRCSATRGSAWFCSEAAFCAPWAAIEQMREVLDLDPAVIDARSHRRARMHRHARCRGHEAPGAGADSARVQGQFGARQQDRARARCSSPRRRARRSSPSSCWPTGPRPNPPMPSAGRRSTARPSKAIAR